MIGSSGRNNMKKVIAIMLNENNETMKTKRDSFILENNRKKQSQTTNRIAENTQREV